MLAGALAVVGAGAAAGFAERLVPGYSGAHTTQTVYYTAESSSKISGLQKSPRLGRAEVAVLSGAEKLLTRRHPHLIIETHSASLEAQCIAILRSTGYSPAIVDQRRWLGEKRGSERNRWVIAEGPRRGTDSGG